MRLPYYSDQTAAETGFIHFHRCDFEADGTNA
jgi:hypothetical protein